MEGYTCEKKTACKQDCVACSNSVHGVYIVMLRRKLPRSVSAEDRERLWSVYVETRGEKYLNLSCSDGLSGKSESRMLAAAVEEQ